MPTLVRDAVGRSLVRAGIDQVFGVVGSGNFHITNAMVGAGARFVAARHEGGATTMADAYARVSGRVAAVTVHQGCGLTNAMTGLTEAAKSRTPLVVVAAEATAATSNFAIDQAALADAVGAVPLRIEDADTAARCARDAVATAIRDRRAVLLNVPLDVQERECDDPPSEWSEPLADSEPLAPDPRQVIQLAKAVAQARRPVFVAGRGGRACAEQLRAAAHQAGALLAESAVARGLFHDEPWSIGVSGGFSPPGVADLIGEADLIVGWGCTLNMWTMRHGTLIHPDATVVQVDDTRAALGRHRDLTLGVLGDVGRTAEALVAQLDSPRTGYRTPAVRALLDAGQDWRSVPFTERSTGDAIDPRTLTVAVDRILPRERVVAVDSGNFMGYPSMFLDVPDEQGFCFTQAFQSVGLGLSTAIGAALARPDRLAVAALGDGGALMTAMELETVVRLGLDMLVLVYNDHAYGAEVHHFGPHGHPMDTVVFPDTDVAAIGEGFGFEGVTVRTASDLDAVRRWVEGPRDRPMLVDAKVVGDQPSWWLEEAFRGH